MTNIPLYCSRRIASARFLLESSWKCGMDFFPVCCFWCQIISDLLAWSNLISSGLLGKNVPVVTSVHSCTFCDTFKAKCPVSGDKGMFGFIQNRWTWIYFFFFFYTGCCMYRLSSEMKCPVSVAKRLMLYRIWKWRTTNTKPDLKSNQ